MILYFDSTSAVPYRIFSCSFLHIFSLFLNEIAEFVFCLLFCHSTCKERKVIGSIDAITAIFAFFDNCNNFLHIFLFYLLSNTFT